MIASIVYIVLVVGGLLYLIKKKRDTEAKFPLKIIGYYILGVFAFKFNGIALPLGFIIYLLFFRPKVNADIKRQAAIFGLIIFIIVQWITPITVYMWESRTITIEHELESAFTIDFAEENELITKELKLEESDIKLDNFSMNYTQSGNITDLSWEMLGEEDNEYDYYRIQYFTDKKEYEISKSHHEEWSQFVFLVDTKHYFENLDLLDIQDITIAKGKFSSYKLFSYGERSQYDFAENEPHDISNGEIKKLSKKQLPVDAFYISTYALKRMSEETDEQGNIIQEGWEGTEFTDYLFDITPIEDEEDF
ncbi:hypothetical protein NQZ71_22640 (plasmid) [Niallia taxi]|uniref:hypothetical protein n=1 Tax=Niallia taxi TaxID=2499688 RepID=UPI00293480C4|nr:hypothetical protein [Niallia taxi]WOD65963.1 hypothetical protein NQZ71_22640 [Niallia taxi]